MEKCAFQVNLWRLWLLVLALMVTAACSKGESTPEELRIALIVPLSGDLADVGQVSVKAAEMALSDQAASGGMHLGGRAVTPKLVIIDNLDTIEGAVNAVRQAVNSDKVSVIIGGQLSRNAIPMAKVAEDSHIPMISPGSTNPETTAGKRFIYRIPYIDPFQGMVMAKYARDPLQADTAGVLFDQASDYNAGLAESFTKAFASLGGEVVARLVYATGQTDVSGLARDLVASGAKVLFLPNYHHEIPSQVAQVRALGFTGPILGGDSWEMLTGSDLVGLDDCFYSTLWSEEIPTPRSSQFVAAWRATQGQTPQPTAALTYDAFGLLFHSLRGQERVDPASIQAGLRAVTVFEGVTGTYHFNGNADPQKSAVILRIANGTARYVGSVE